MFPVSCTSVCGPDQREGPDLLHECLKSVSWPAAKIGHSDVTLSQCCRETKQDMNEALVLQTSLGVKAVSLVTVLAVYTANYMDNFSGVSLCTVGSLIPPAPYRDLHLTNKPGNHKQAMGKASSSSSCSAVLCRTYTAQTALRGCTQDALCTDVVAVEEGVCLNPCAQRLLQGTFGGLSHCNRAFEVETRGRIMCMGQSLVRLIFGFCALSCHL